MVELTAADEKMLLSFDRSQLELDTPEADAAYQHMMSVLVKHRYLVVKDMYTAIGRKLHIGTLKHFLEVYRTFTGDRKRAVLDYIQSQDVLAPVLRDAAERVNATLFSELTKFLGIESVTLNHATEYLTGTYQIWRHSVSIPGWYIKGFLQIEAKENVLFAKSHHRYIPSEADAEHIKPRFEDLQGYMFRQPGGRCFLFLSDRARRQVRICIFSATAPVTHQYDDTAQGKPHMTRVVFSLCGMELGTDEGRSLTTPLYVERVSDETPPLYSEANRRFRDSLKIYPAEKVPAKILAVLRQPLTLF